MRAVAISSILALCAASCAPADDGDRLVSAFDQPLENDGRVFDVTLYPYDMGSREFYAICWARCTPEHAAGAVSGFDARVPGEFDGYHGDRPARVRLQFNAYCFKPHALCAEMVFFFKELEPVPKAN